MRGRRGSLGHAPTGIDWELLGIGSLASIPGALLGARLTGRLSTAALLRAIGAELVLESGDLRQRRVVDGGSGFSSQNDRRPHFGLGRREWVDRVIIHWPSGARQVLTRPAIDQIVTITEPAR